MEARTTGWTIGLIVLAVFAFVAMFAIQGEQSSKELSAVTGARNAAQAEVDKTREAIAAMQQRLVQAKESAAARKSVSDDIADLESAIISAEKQKNELKRQWEKTRDEFQKDITAAGRKQIGRQFPSLKTGSETLENVTVKAVAADVVTLEHSAGLTKVPLAKLPPELAPAFVPGWKPELKIKEPAALPEVADIPPLEQEETPEKPAAEQPAAAGVNPFKAQVEKLSKERSDLAVKIDAARADLRRKRQAYELMNNQHSLAKASGKIVTVPKGLEEARQAAESLQQKLDTAQQQFNRMTSQLQDLEKKEADWQPPAK